MKNNYEEKIKYSCDLADGYYKSTDGHSWWKVDGDTLYTITRFGEAFYFSNTAHGIYEKVEECTLDEWREELANLQSTMYLTLPLEVAK